MHPPRYAARLTALALFACAAPAAAQDTLSLSLPDAVQRAQAGDQVQLAT